jgi:phosphohistidine phosphatase
MKLLIVRHADAGEAATAKSPLTVDGAKKFRAAAKSLGELVPKVDVTLSSSLVRAWQTAQILHDEAGWAEPQKFPLLENTASPAQILNALAPYAQHERVALVGHEPTQSALVSLLIGSANIEMKKGSVACVEIDSLYAGAGRLKWLLTVKTLRG